MRWWDAVKARLRSLGRRSQAERELEEELQLHLEREIERRVGAGMPADDAQREARLEFGGLARIKEDCREAWGARIIDQAAQDLRYGVRTLRRSPAFLFVAAATLAIGIGANTTIFSLVNGVLWNPAWVDKPETLVALWQVAPPGSASFPTSTQRVRNGWRGDLSGGRSPEISPADFIDIRARSRLFARVAAASPYSYTLTDRGDPETLQAFSVTRGFFDLTMRPLIGRTFIDSEFEAASGAQPVLLSYALWKSRYGADPNVAGSPIRLDGQVHTVVGVMPKGFQLPVGGYYSRIDVWTPLQIPAELAEDRADSFWLLMARLAPGVEIGSAQQELDAIGAALASEYPRTNASRRFLAVPIRDHLAGTLGPILPLLMMAAGVVLMIGCANVAGLQLVRGSRRHREFTMRLALGAGRARIAGQILIETALVASLGTAAGLGLAYALLPILLWLDPETTPLFGEIKIDGTVLAFCIAASVVAMLAAGIGPALRFSSVRAQKNLPVGMPSGVGDTLTTKRARDLLVAAQIALSVILLAGAGLLLQTLRNLIHVDPGYRTERILSAQVTGSAYLRSASDRINFARLSLERMRAIPGVLSAGAVSNFPLHDTPVDYRDDFAIEGRPRPAGAPSERCLNTVVTDGYFETMGIALLSGRNLSRLDSRDTERVAVISQTMARRYWSGQDPIGSRVQIGFPANGTVTVVGVVSDVQHRRPDESPEPEVYLPHAQVPTALLTFAVRSAEGVNPPVSAVRAILREEVPSMPLGEFATIETFRRQSLRLEAFSAALGGGFAATALLLAAIGLYASIAYTVETRRKEIGVRMAVGASMTDVLRLIAGQGFRIAAVGLCFGVGVAYFATRALANMLFGLTPQDPFIFAGITLLTLATVAMACAIPARRAVRIDPAVALRTD